MITNPNPNKRHQKNLEEIVFNGKLPPQALDLEEAVLGAAMLEKDAPGKVMELITADTFYSDSNKLIWQAIVNLERSNKPIDILTVTEQLRVQSSLELAGGAFYVTQLTNRVASAANIEYHSHILIQKYIQRQMIHIAGEIGKRAFEDTADAFELVDSSISLLEAIGFNSAGKIESLYDVARKAYKQMLNDSVSEQEFTGLPSKFKTLNDLSGGYHAPDNIVVAGGTGEGKTTFAFEEAYNMAMLGHPVAFLSAEVKSHQLAWKLFSNKISEEIKVIRRAKGIDETKWDELTDFVEFTKNVPLYIVDVSNFNSNQIKSLTKELKRKHGIKMMFLDYLQLIDGPPEMRFGTRESEVSFVSKEMKKLAMMMDIPIMLLSQLLDVDGEKKRIYALRDLRESKAIGHNADEVLLIYHPFMHGVSQVEEGGRHYKEGDVIIIRAKCRLGKKGKVHLKFTGAFNRFEDEEDKSISSIDYTKTSKENSEDTTDDLPF